MNNSVHIDGLNAIKNNESLSIISGDCERSGNVMASLQNFINDRTTLQGEQWDKVRGKLGVYKNAFDKRSEAAAILVDAINRAVQLLIDYLGDDIYLDPSELEELRTTVLQCESQITSLQSMIDAKEAKYKTGENGEQIYLGMVSVYSESEKENFRTQINELKEVIKECKRLIAKIEGLQAIYDQAKAILSEAEPSINDFKQLVSSIVPSEKVYYNPA